MSQNKQFLQFMHKTIIILLLILTVTSCKKSDSNEKDKIKTAHWLLGNWENNSVDGNLSETWKKVNDSTFNGQSYFIKAKDTLHFEIIQLKQKGEELFYVSTIKGQNNDKPITFKLTNTTEKQLVFINTKHDYPQKVSYTKITNDSLVIQISGIQQGKPSSERFSMKKSK